MCVVTMCIGSWWLKGFIWVESRDRMQDFLDGMPVFAWYSQK